LRSEPRCYVGIETSQRGLGLSLISLTTLSIGCVGLKVL
jgi:hypothetical protein